MKVKSLLLVGILIVGLLIGTVSAVDMFNSTTFKGGVINGAMNGTGSTAVAGWVGDEMYGWYAIPVATAGVVYYDTNVSHTGPGSLKLNNTDATGRWYVSTFNTVTGIQQKYMIPVKSSTNYTVQAWIKTDNVPSGSAKYLLGHLKSDLSSAGSSTDSANLSGTNDWTPVNTTFTTYSEEAYMYIYLYNSVAGNPSSAWFDDLTLEEVVTDNYTGTGVRVYPVVRGNTSVDNIDLSYSYHDTNFTLGSGATDSARKAQQIIPTKSKLTNVTFYKYTNVGSPTFDVAVAIETDSSDTPSGTVLASNTITSAQWGNVEGEYTVSVPCIVTPGTKYWITFTPSAQGDGTNYRLLRGGGTTPYLGYSTYSNGAWAAISTLYSLYFKEHYVKNTEATNVTANGVTMSLDTGDATGLLSGAKVDTYRGYYNYTWNPNATSSSFAAKASDVYSSSVGDYSPASSDPRIINNIILQYDPTLAPYGDYLQYNSPQDTKLRNITWKVNFILPVKELEITSYVYGDAGNYLAVSSDGTTFDNIASLSFQNELLSNVTKTRSTHYAENTTLYFRLLKDDTNGYFTPERLVINATLNTTINNQTVLLYQDGVNTININSYGNSVSSSLDPSLLVDLWLVQGESALSLPIVSWFTDRTTVVFPGWIKINSTSENSPTFCNYSMGDGNWYNSSDIALCNFSYQYKKRGRFLANVTVGNGAGTNTSASLAKNITVIGYQGFTPTPDKCTYSVSRELDVLEKIRVDCQLCSRC